MNQESEDGWWSLLNLLTIIKNTEELNAFFDLFLTIEEKEHLATRYLIIKELLEEKKSQREISDKLKVSIAKITRGSNALKIINPKMKEFLKLKMT